MYFLSRHGPPHAGLAAYGARHRRSRAVEASPVLSRRGIWSTRFMDATKPFKDPKKRAEPPSES